MHEPVTEITLEAPGGLVRVRAECRNGKAERIFVRNLPSFADKLDAKLEVEGLGTLTVEPQAEVGIDLLSPSTPLRTDDGAQCQVGQTLGHQALRGVLTTKMVCSACPEATSPAS